MSRNLKRDYLKKLMAIKTENGYKIDVANYIYNPNTAHDYPNITKIINETADSLTISTIYYLKLFSGDGAYIHTIQDAPKKEGWHIVTELSRETIETAKRFNLNKLIELASGF